MSAVVVLADMAGIILDFSDWTRMRSADCAEQCPGAEGEAENIGSY